jgi:hypothetical protein
VTGVDTWQLVLHVGHARTVAEAVLLAIGLGVSLGALGAAGFGVWRVARGPSALGKDDPTARRQELRRARRRRALRGRGAGEADARAKPYNRGHDGDAAGPLRDHK